MKNVALALLASVALFACTEPSSDGAGSSEAAYSIKDPPRAIQIDPTTVHLECTTSHGSFVVLTFEDQIFTAHRNDSIQPCLDLRSDLASRTELLAGSLVGEHGAINRTTIDVPGILGTLESWGE